MFKNLQNLNAFFLHFNTVIDKDKNDYISELYEQTDRENDVLREDSRVLGYFKEYLPEQEYEKIVALGEQRERGRYERKR